MKENTELDELQRRLHDAHESSAMLRAKIDRLEAEIEDAKSISMNNKQTVWVVYDHRDCEIVGVYANETMAKEVSYRSIWYRREAVELNTK